MQFIKEQISQGNLQLAKYDSQNKTVPMQLSELEQKREVLNKRGLILQKLKTLSEDEKQQWVNLKKLHANELYKAQRWTQASQAYLQALLGLDTNGKSEENVIKANKQLKYPLLLNIATCLYKKQEFAAAVQICNKILEERDGKTFVKVYYKKAYILVAHGKLQQAKQVAMKGFQILIKQPLNTNISSKQITKQDFVKLFEEIAGKTDNDKAFYKKIFKKEQQSDSGDEEKEELIKKQEQLMAANVGLLSEYSSMVGAFQTKVEADKDNLIL